MRSFKKLLLLSSISASLVFGAISLAQAEKFVWKNAAEDISLEFPDRWATVSTVYDDELIRIAAPAVSGSDDDVKCRVRVREDGRFKMHPISHSGALQRTYVSDAFWQEYAHEFKHARINDVQDNDGLGRGFASQVDMTFESFEHPKIIRRAMAFASLYNNKVHIFECSAKDNAFFAWKPLFLNILQSVDFKSFAPYPHGLYRNFYEDESVIRSFTPEEDFVF